MENIYNVNYRGKTYELVPFLCEYFQTDTLGRVRAGIALEFERLDGKGYCVFTISFGKFIGEKNCAYLDVKRCPFAQQLLEQGIGTIVEGVEYRKGFRRYPLVHFNEAFLEAAGSEIYADYCKDFDNPRSPLPLDNDEEDDEDDSTIYDED